MCLEIGMGLAGLESARSLCDWLGREERGEKMWSELMRAWGGRKELWGIILSVVKATARSCV